MYKYNAAESEETLGKIDFFINEVVIKDNDVYWTIGETSNSESSAEQNEMMGENNQTFNSAKKKAEMKKSVRHGERWWESGKNN